MNTYFGLDDAEVVVSPEKTAYGYTSSVRNASQGITGSVAAYGDYVYYGDDSGVLQCVDLNTMQPVWAISLGDSIMRRRHLSATMTEMLACISVRPLIRLNAAVKCG